MGVASTWGFTVVGVEAVPVHIEAHARSGLPGVTIVGLPGAAVKEARERIRSAATSCGMHLPTRRITVNLSPGDIPKEGPGFDLPVALATLAACGHLNPACAKAVAAVGELSLEGDIRPARGVVSIAEAAGRLGLRLLIVPVEDLGAVSQVADLPVAGVRTLREAVLVLRESKACEWIQARGERWLRLRSRPPEDRRGSAEDMAQVYGRHQAKRALEIVAAGGHHLLMVGAPGVGKTMLARRLVGILPPLDRGEALEVTRIMSATGLGDFQAALEGARPFRSPHHTASRAALVGGGANLRPGEMSLAHRGVLFMDELPEFARDALEALRQPMEEGRVVVSRRAGTSVFPAEFTLVGAMNPCPCGYLGHPQKECSCTATNVHRYRSRVSGPLLDRIDALVEVPPLTVAELEGAEPGERSSVIAGRVGDARAFARERRKRRSFCDGCGPEEENALDGPASRLLKKALAGHHLGGRGYVRVIGLSRTVADLEQSLQVKEEHLSEALALRLDQRRIDMR